MMFMLLCPAIASAQGLGNVVLKHYPGVPTGGCSTNQMALNNATGALYVCFAGAWSEISGGGGSDVGGNAIPFTIASSCTGFTNCLQWVGDDSTDNCGTTTTTFINSVNTAAATALVPVFIYGPEGNGAYKLASCHIEFTTSGTGNEGVSIHDYASIDCEQTSALANCIQLGSTGNRGDFYWDGGYFTGGANVTKGLFECGVDVDCVIDHTSGTQVGGTNATTGDCTNFYAYFDPGTYQTDFSYNQATNTGGGFCGYHNDNGASGQNTAHVISNTLGDGGGTCGSIGIDEGGASSTLIANNIYGFGQPVLLDYNSNVAGTQVIGNEIDADGCAAFGVSADVQIGAASSSATAGPFTITDNAIVGGSHVSNFLAIAGNSSVSLFGVNATGNVAVDGATAFAPAAINCAGATAFDNGCMQDNNPNMTPSIAAGEWFLPVHFYYKIYLGVQTGNVSSAALYTATGAYQSFDVGCTISAYSGTGTSPSCIVNYTDATGSTTSTTIAPSVAAASTTNPVITQGVARIFPGAGAITISTSGYVSTGGPLTFLLTCQLTPIT